VHLWVGVQCQQVSYLGYMVNPSECVGSTLVCVACHMRYHFISTVSREGCRRVCEVLVLMSTNRVSLASRTTDESCYVVHARVRTQACVPNGLWMQVHMWACACCQDCRQSRTQASIEGSQLGRALVYQHACMSGLSRPL
jgi:hypothetical protein